MPPGQQESTSGSAQGWLCVLLVPSWPSKSLSDSQTSHPSLTACRLNRVSERPDGRGEGRLSCHWWSQIRWSLEVGVKRNAARRIVKFGPQMRAQQSIWGTSTGETSRKRRWSCWNCQCSYPVATGHDPAAQSASASIIASTRYRCKHPRFSGLSSVRVCFPPSDNTGTSFVKGQMASPVTNPGD